ncbi:MAG: hypothetical protein GY862_27875 [Gammaproteobacteria bacterium]|nr:hypothetical protein [Gammaproteobacteria bacterium]
MDAIEFLHTAQELIQGQREADWRNAGSRACYAAYHCCIAFHRQHPGLQRNPGSSHDRLVRDFLDSPDKAVRKLGNQLKQARYSNGLKRIFRRTACITE